MDTSKWKFNHTMIRIKDPKASIKFFETLGLKVINKIEQPENKFDLIFMAYDSPGAVDAGKHWTDREGIIEMTHNYGTENDDNYTVNNGNKDPHKGFGHVCISVDNIQAACQRFEDAGYKFQKKLSDGRMRSIAFLLSPDGYWVEIISFNDHEKTADVKDTDPSTYRMNHSMIRVKDPEKSLDFYQNTLGMKLLRTSEQKEAGFNLYFLGYGDSGKNEGSNKINPGSAREGILELTWNYGTEKEEGPIYHNGNDQPQGFGHIAITVDDIDKACAYLEDKKVNWKKRLTDGRMKDIAFILDCDGYWIEVVQNEAHKKRVAW